MALFTMGCESKKEPKKILPDSNGRINELLVVLNEKDWEGNIGNEVRKTLAEPVLGLPQPEPQFDVFQVNDKAFSSMFKASRAILHIYNNANKKGIRIEKNQYASPQRVVSISGKNSEDIVEIINKNKDTILKVFNQLGIESVQKNISRKYWETSNIKTFEKQRYSVKIPSNYRRVDDNGDFLWYRHRLSRESNSIEFISYTLPISSPEDEQGKTIIKNRDFIGKKYIKGETEGSYAITEEAYTPHTFPTKLAGKKAFETRGKWEIKGPYMAAGPFINYTVVDKENNRLIVLEGFVYAPAINKRDYIFELEAIIKTLKIEQ